MDIFCAYGQSIKGLKIEAFIKDEYVAKMFYPSFQSTLPSCPGNCWNKTLVPWIRSLTFLLAFTIPSPLPNLCSLSKTTPLRSASGENQHFELWQEFRVSALNLTWVDECKQVLHTVSGQGQSREFFHSRVSENKVKKNLLSPKCWFPQEQSKYSSNPEGDSILLNLQTVLGASLIAQFIKNPPAMRETWVQSLGSSHPKQSWNGTYLSYLPLTDFKSHEESWAPKNWGFWTVLLEKTLESPLDSKEIQPVHPKGDQSRVFIGGTDAEAETPILGPPHVKS